MASTAAANSGATLVRCGSSAVVRAAAAGALLRRNAACLALLRSARCCSPSSSPRVQQRCLMSSTPDKYVNKSAVPDGQPTFKCPDITTLPPAERAKVEDDLDGVYVLPHFRKDGTSSTAADPSEWRQPHPVWSNEEVNSIVQQHLPPRGLIDWAAYGTVMFLRKTYDTLTGYSIVRQDENAMLRRVIVLETVAGVPGMVAALIRHLRSLRSMKRDFGWIHTLLEEAENERMHLMTAMVLRQPSFLVKLSVMGAQGFFFPFYSLMYALSPKYCHRMVGYLEEQAVVTYTHIVEQIDMGELPGFLAEAPTSIRKYWRLPEGATLRDVFLAIRADEDHHREVNHTFAEVTSCTATNPFPPGF